MQEFFKDKSIYESLSEKKLGMFVHYGIYSALGGFWKGEAISGLGEWIQLHGRIPNAEYEKFARENFLPKESFARDLVRAAKNAGIRYIVLTSKHHDGFCLFKTAVDGYNTYDFYGRDICRELADECRKEGLGIGFYYSHTLDWHEKNGAGNLEVYSLPGTPTEHRNDWDFPDSNIDFSQYFYDKCIPQVKELLTSYGPLELIWFDFPHDITVEQSRELREIVKSIQPGCLINSRIAHGMHDYMSLGDNALSEMPHGINTECLVTLNHTWGYRSDDHEWKSPEDMINIITRNLSAGATMLLNVGPMGDGTLTDETVHILEKIGEFTSANAEAIYGGVEPNPFPSLFDFGKTAMRENKIFFYLNGREDSVAVSGLSISPVRVYLAKNGCEVQFTYCDGELSFNRIADDGEQSVYVAEFEKSPEISSTPKEAGGRLHLHAVGARVAKKSAPDIQPRPLVYNATRGMSEDEVMISNTDKISGWTNNDEYLVFEGEVKGGVYEAELVHSLSRRGYEGKVDAISALLTVGEETHAIGEEKSRFAVSLTGTDNTRVIRDADKFTLPKGKVRIILENTEDAQNIPAIEIRLIGRQ